MNLRRLTPLGVEQFQEYLSQLRGDAKLAPPVHLLENDQASEPVADVEVEQQTFETRLAAAKYLDQLFARAQLTQVDQNIGLWAWLTLFFFDQVCPATSDGTRKLLKETFRYIPARDNYQKYYRHFLLGPLLVYERYKHNVDEAMGLLGNVVHKTDDVFEQVMGKLEWFSNQSVVSVATSLYFADGKYKRGFQGKGPGSPRRFYAVLDQFDVTYDLFGMSPDTLLTLLPKEFDKFRP